MNSVAGKDVLTNVEPDETQESIFQGVARNEISLTRLLHNFLGRDKQFRTDVLSLFTNKPTMDAQIEVEKSLPNGGIADLLIDSPALSIIVEVKSEKFRGRTAKQMFSNEHDDPESYLAYLKSCPVATRRLIFLVPPDWTHKFDVQAEIEKYTLEGRQKGVEVSLVTWEDVLYSHKPGGTFNGLLCREFHKLLKKRFDSIRLEEREISSMVDGKMSLLTVLKLTALIEQVRSKAKNAGMDVSALEVREYEFGFYLIKKRSTKKEEWSVFFGCSPSDWDEQDRPALGIGVDKAFINQSAFKEAARKNFKTARFNGENADPTSWLYVAIPAEDLIAGSDVICSKLRNVWISITSDED